MVWADCIGLDNLWLGLPSAVICDDNSSGVDRDKGYKGDGQMLKVIAVDFDGCLCENKYPEIGEPHNDVIQALLDEQRDGAKLILWTCRTDDMLEAAIEWCKNFGIEFDAFNSNLPESIEYFQSDSRKIWATEYWDDKAVTKPNDRRKNQDA